MKKSFYIVAFATLALLSCTEEADPVVELNDVVNAEVKNEAFTFKAYLEDGTTRGDITVSNGLTWATGDQIGIYVPGWRENQPFTLVGEGGSTNGVFSWDNQTESNTFAENAAAAFYPWQGTGSEVNNVYDGTMYFKLPASYLGYTSGKMLTPLIASLANSSDNIRFKHAGAAVKVTINNLPAGAHSIGMYVDGQQISGDFQINPANAGTDALSLSGDANNHVWLNYTNNSENKWTFIFPVPALTKPKLSFQIYDVNDVLVWSKNLKAQSSDLGRADILVMPALSIEPYSKFDTKSSWYVRGTCNGWDITPMITDGSVSIAKGIVFDGGGEFKIAESDWEKTSYPKNNYSVSAGTYDIIFNHSSHEIKVVATGGCPYPDVPE